MAKKKGAKFSFTGTQEVIQNLKNLATRFPDAADQALYEEAEAIMTLAKIKCPVDTGTLMNTGYVHPPSGGEVEMGFGTDYGIYVHERTGATHVKGERKFFENAINERSAGFKERLAARIRMKVGI